MAANQEDVFPPKDGEAGGEEEGNVIAPQSTAETEKKIREVFKKIEDNKQKRTEANEHLGALREELVSLGFPKKAQSAVLAYKNLNEKDREFFDQAYMIMRKAIGEPVQTSLDLEVIDGGKED